MEWPHGLDYNVMAEGALVWEVTFAHREQSRVGIGTGQRAMQPKDTAQGACQPGVAFYMSTMVTFWLHQHTHWVRVLLISLSLELFSWTHKGMPDQSPRCFSVTPRWKPWCIITRIQILIYLTVSLSTNKWMNFLFWVNVNCSFNTVFRGILWLLLRQDQ